MFFLVEYENGSIEVHFFLLEHGEGKIHETVGIRLVREFVLINCHRTGLLRVKKITNVPGDAIGTMPQVAPIHGLLEALATRARDATDQKVTSVMGPLRPEEVWDLVKIVEKRARRTDASDLRCLLKDMGFASKSAQKGNPRSMTRREFGDLLRDMGVTPQIVDAVFAKNGMDREAKRAKEALSAAQSSHGKRRKRCGSISVRMR